MPDDVLHYIASSGFMPLALLVPSTVLGGADKTSCLEMPVYLHSTVLRVWSTYLKLNSL